MVNDISQNIISQLGGGSGINTSSLVDQLVELERLPEENRLNQREERIEAQISGLGMLRSAVDKFESSLAPLSDPDTFNAKQASISDTSLMAVNSLEPNAVPGNYRIKVEQVAQSHSLSSGSFESPSSEIGQGELTLRFGSWDEGMDEFSLNPDVEGATIEIDEGNNTLGGLRDAINQADVGVQASIVGHEGDYQLLLTSPTGESMELEMTAEEDPAEPGLAAFNFNGAQQNFTQQQQGQDAVLRVNGLQVTRSDNTIDDVIEGVEFEAFNSSETEEISINISEDRSHAEEAIREFVNAYNEFHIEMEHLLDPDEGEDGQGSLRSDPLAGNMMRSIRSTLGAAVPGIEDGFNTLANMGIRTQLDGTLEIVEDGLPTDFRAAMDDNFDMVKDLFAPSKSSSSSRIDVTDHSSRTQPGNYEVEITQQATQGVFAGQEITEDFPLDTTGKDYSFSIYVDGHKANISLPEGRTYDTAEELAAEWQSLINASTEVREGQARVEVSFNTETDAFEFQSNTWGSESRVDFSDVSEDLQADLGLSDGSGQDGLNVAGTIDGVEAQGVGNVLRAASGTPAEGLRLTVAPGATSASVNFSQGFGAGLSESVDTYVRNSGLISERESNLRNDLDDIDDARERMDRRSEAFRARQEAQFRAMEQIVRSLNSTGDFLDGLNDRMPFTASN